MLGVNEYGCVTVDDVLLTAPEGSTVEEDGGEVVIRLLGFEDLSLGDELVAGGYVHRETIETLRDHYPQIDRCLAEGTQTAEIATIGEERP